MNGFFIQEVRAKGVNVPDAIVQFDRGLSILTGPSDTGKSLVADAINFVFGASTPLRAINEYPQYNRVLVQISEYESGAIHTIERAWAGGGANLYDLPAAEIEDSSQARRTLLSNNDSTVNSISGFLLSLSGLLNKKLRITNAAAKNSLSFRDLPNYVLTNEQQIITKLSPILSGQDTRKTKEISLFKLILTGHDDSEIIETDDKKTRSGLKRGRTEVLNSLIEDVNKRITLQNRTEVELHQELLILEESLLRQTTSFQNDIVDIGNLREQKKNLWVNLQKSEARFEHVNELITRFSLLDDHYHADKARLESTQESGKFFAELDEGPCPTCGSDPIHHIHDGVLSTDDITVLTQACEAEQQKIDLLIIELNATIDKLNAEYIDIFRDIEQIKTELESIETTLSQEFEPRVLIAKSQIDDLLIQRRGIDQGIAAFDELKKLQSLLDQFETQSKSEAKRRTYDGIPTGSTEDLAIIVEKILTNWNYPDINRVTFDPLTQDIVINGKPRGSHGKGYRAITYSAFIIGILFYCREKNLPHPGFVILDSPLVTYRKPDKLDDNLTDEDFLNEGMVPAFYEHLSNLSEECQVIVIENEEPSFSVKERSTYTHFTRNNLLGRYGFLEKSFNAT